LKIALKKYTSLKQKFAAPAQTFFSADQLEQLIKLNKKEYKSRFVTQIGDRIRHIEVEQVAYFYADDDTVYLVSGEKKKFIINYTLDQLERLLEPKYFFRSTGNTLPASTPLAMYTNTLTADSKYCCNHR
jgi:DNA-binding LytR/AlgR family response regulator